MNELYEMAKKYRSIGWNVIPLYNHSKNPYPLEWKQYQERMATDEEVGQWFHMKNLTGLGVITGKISGIVVLDEDMYKEGGLQVKVRTGMMSQTARQGKHHFFKYVEPIKSSGLRKGIYVEIKADGGFVVLPPSQVNFPDGSVGSYEWIDKCMPEEMLPITEEQLSPYRSNAANADRVNVMELSRATLGTQHNSLRSIALSTFARFRKDEWAEAEDFIRWEASQFDPPHPEDRVDKMIKDAKDFILKNKREDVEDEIQKEPSLPNRVNDLVEERIADRKLEAMAPKTPWPELDRIIKGCIPGHTYLLTGDTNVGKTTLACNFAEALRLQNKKTLYIALEPDVNVVEYLASVRLKKPFDQITDEELYIPEDKGHIQVFLQRDIEKVQDLIKSLESIPHFDLIVIDHIGYFVQNERDWIQQQSNVVKQLKFLANTKKTAIMMIAHLRKPGTVKKSTQWVPTQNDISGSAAFKQDNTEVLIAFRPTKDTDEYSIEFADKGVLLVTKTKCGPNGSVPLIFEQGSAKVYSEEEALSTLEGREFLKRRDLLRYSEGMVATAFWNKDEIDTGNDD